ncbi:MAG: hypothetical protein HY606_02880 [Planctomycetes bacterium]|nr:hypothetical protein [Planctomycetota bacterium]
MNHLKVCIFILLCALLTNEKSSALDDQQKKITDPELASLIHKLKEGDQKSINERENLHTYDDISNQIENLAVTKYDKDQSMKEFCFDLAIETRTRDLVSTFGAREYKYFKTDAKEGKDKADCLFKTELSTYKETKTLKYTFDLKMGEEAGLETTYHLKMNKFLSPLHLEGSIWKDKKRGKGGAYEYEFMYNDDEKEKFERTSVNGHNKITAKVKAKFNTVDFGVLFALVTCLPFQKEYTLDIVLTERAEGEVGGGKDKIIEYSGVEHISFDDQMVKTHKFICKPKAGQAVPFSFWISEQRELIKASFDAKELTLVKK